MIETFAITDASLWLNFVYFLIVLFIANYIPGSLLLQKLKTDKFSKIILSIILGIVLWGYQGYIFGYLGFRFGSYIYLGICLIFWLLQKHRFRIKLQKVKSVKEIVILSLLLISGTFVQLVSIWFHGISIPQGLYFCCGIDAMYHIALTQELVKQFPPLEPGTFNTVVSNYHYFSNMIVAEWVRVFNLPLVATYFQFSTVLLSFLIGAAAITFGKTLGLGNKYIYWLLFFVYFSGSATYVIILLSRHILDVESIVLYDSTILWASPPRAYGLVVFLAALSLLYLWLKSRKIYLGILSGLLFGCLISIKVYFGLFVLAGFCILNLYFLLKKDIKALLPSLITVIFSLLLYIPINNGSGGLFFVGMWRFENFIVFPPLGLTQLELARTTYLSQGNWIRVTLYEIIFVILYFIATFGTLLTALIQTPTSLRSLPKELHLFLIGGIMTSLGAGMFFIQDTGGANSSQFIITVIAIISIYAALAVNFWTNKIQNKLIGLVLILLVILLTIPRAAHDTFAKLNQISRLSDFTLQNDELAALKFLRQAPSGVILSPLSDCLYIPLLTNKPVYACNDAGVLTDHKVKNGKERIEIAKQVYTGTNISSLDEHLRTLGIKYVYVKRGSPEEKIVTSLSVIFQNKEVVILEVH